MEDDVSHEVRHTGGDLETSPSGDRLENIRNWSRKDLVQKIEVPYESCLLTCGGTDCVQPLYSAMVLWIQSRSLLIWNVHCLRVVTSGLLGEDMSFTARSRTWSC